MTVRAAFPIYINEIDWDLPDWWYDNLLEAGFELTDDIPTDKENFVFAFSDENIENYPVLHELKRMFSIAIRDLAAKYGNSRVKPDDIDSRLAESESEFPSRDHKAYPVSVPHFHPLVSCTGLFYIDAGDENQGGNLMLFDPSNNQMVEFVSPEVEYIEPKRGKMVIFPGHMRHSVTQYTGSALRRMVVLDLKCLGVTIDKGYNIWDGTAD